jgi:flagellar assembly factor FliW
MTLAAVATPTRMIVNSDLLGPLEVDEDEIVHFSAGLFGFPECRNFVFLPADREGMYWLQSTDHGTLAFLLADPFRFFDGYTVDLAPADRTDLIAHSPSDVVILAIVTLPRRGETLPTANLQGPIAINLEARRAKQLALSESPFGIRSPIDLSATEE